MRHKTLEGGRPQGLRDIKASYEFRPESQFSNIEWIQWKKTLAVTDSDMRSRTMPGTYGC